MTESIPTLPARVPGWTKLKKVIWSLITDHKSEERGWLQYLAAMKDAVIGVTDGDIARSLNGAEIPSPELRRAAFRWCQRQIASMKEQLKTSQSE